MRLFGWAVRVLATRGTGPSGCPGHTLCSVDPNSPAGPFQPPARRTTARLLVPDECRKWARASGVPLHDLLQCFVDLGASVLELIPVGSGVVPSLAQLLSVVSVVPPDSPLADRSTRPSELLVAPSVVPLDLPFSELAALRSGTPIEACPVVFSRLRSYAAACHLIHTRRDVPHLLYLVASYAVSIGVPGAVADVVARRAVAPLGVLPEFDQDA